MCWPTVILMTSMGYTTTAKALLEMTLTLLLYYEDAWPARKAPPFRWVFSLAVWAGAKSAGGDGGGEGATVEQTQIRGGVRRRRGGMERKDWDKAGEGSGEGQSGEKWRELISIDHHRQLHYQHLLDTQWIHNHFLLCVGGCAHVCLRPCVYAVSSILLSKQSQVEFPNFSTPSVYLLWVYLGQAQQILTGNYGISYYGANQQRWTKYTTSCSEDTEDTDPACHTFQYK